MKQQVNENNLFDLIAEAESKGYSEWHIQRGETRFEDMCTVEAYMDWLNGAENA